MNRFNIILIPLSATFNELVSKAEHYCAYQERSHFEVRMKLVEWNGRGDTLEEVLAHLIENDFLNEERFALSYARGKLRINHWGRNKIKQGLKLKKVSENLIKKALSQLEEEEYEKILRTTLEKKANTLKEKNDYRKKSLLSQYALSRGFELDISLKIIESI